MSKNALPLLVCIPMSSSLHEYRSFVGARALLAVGRVLLTAN